MEINLVPVINVISGAPAQSPELQPPVTLGQVHKSVLAGKGAPLPIFLLGSELHHDWNVRPMYLQLHTSFFLGS